jgi:hypothetical protein
VKGAEPTDQESLARNARVFAEMMEHEADFGKNRELLDQMFSYYSAGPSVRAIYGPYTTTVRHLLFNAGALAQAGDSPGSLFLLQCAGEVVRLALRALFHAAHKDGLIPDYSLDRPHQPKGP